MDTQDVSGLPEHFHHIQEQKKRIRNAHAQKGQRPARQPRWAMVSQFLLSMGSAARARGSDQTYIGTSFVPSPYPPCVKAAGELTKTGIDDLVLETQHRGKYLLLRCITPQDRMTAVMAIVEDENGDTILLQLYHQEEADENPKDILKEGVVLLLKGPYLKFTANGGYGLRVDHLSDVEFLPPGDKRIPGRWEQTPRENDTAIAWKIKGNEDFKESSYRAAIQTYTRGLECSPTDEQCRTITLNRSLAYLKAKSFDAALVDAESAALSANPPVKALFNKAQALYGLQRFRECCEVLKALRFEQPNLGAAKDLLDRAIGRLAEETKGRYKFKHMYDEAAKLRPPHLDHATFVGPVAVKKSGISPGGRGLFTTKAVSAGDLLLCEKAFSFSFVDEPDGGRLADVTVLIDAEADTANMGGQPELINRMIRKLYKNPSLSKAVTDLHHGAYEPVGVYSVDGSPVVDSFLVRRIIALNSFGCPLTSRNFYLRAALEPTSLIRLRHFHSCGVWPTASYINHSCIPNASRSFIGDMMVVRATRDLHANTELTWWYLSPPTEPASYFARQRPLLKTWGFMCKCAICREARDTPESALEKRRRLWSEIRRLVPPVPLGQGQGAGRERAVGTAVLRKAEGLVASLKATYKRPAAQAPRLGVSNFELVLASRYGTRMQPAESARLALEGLASLGFVIEGGDLGRGGGEPPVVREWGLVVEHVIDCWMVLSDAYGLVAPGLAAFAEQYAKTAYKICFGEDETFDETYGNLLGTTVGKKTFR